MTTPTDDKNLDEYLSRQSQVSQRYRGLESDAVPVHLDERILAQAREALAAPADGLARVRTKRRRLMQWGVPTAIAASALLVVSIVIRSGTQHEVAPAAGPAASPPTTDTAATTAARPEAAGQSAANEVVLIAPPRDAVTESSPFAPPPTVAERARAERQATNIQAQTIAAYAERARETLASESSMGIGAPQSVGESVEPVVPAAPAVADEDKRFSSQAETDDQSATAARSVVRQGRQEAVAKQSVDRADQELTTMRTLPRPAAVAVAPPATNDAAGTSKEEAVDARRSNPDAWLEHIRHLRREGQAEAADEEWKEFRAAYPDYSIATDDLARGRN